jgi:hypothetical protein
MTIIVGAGIAGLLSASIFQRAHVFEAGPADQINHKAVLRFRSSAVGDAVGIEFRKVKVHKGIWDGVGFCAPNIELANLYSKKAIGRLADRSIWNIDPVERFIAPEDFIAQLAMQCSDRIDWESPIKSMQRNDPVISTIPLHMTAKMLGMDDVMPQFKFAPITVRRWHIPSADVFQTVYFPQPETSLYRASITGNLLIAEYMEEADDYDLFEPFGLHKTDCVPHDRTKQSYGKIAPIDEQWRRKFVHQATVLHGVYSVGRFATWRNILLDDVLHDIYVVKKLIDSDAYSLLKYNAKQ